MEVEGSRVYRVKAVAKRFDVSVATIYRAIESGQLEALKLGTGRGALRVTEEAVRAYALVCGRAAYEGALEGGGDPSAADGLACVVCGGRFLDVGVQDTALTPQRPVGRSQSQSGSQVFACTAHAEQAAGRFEGVA